MLGIAELHAGNGKAAVRHLASAVRILLAQTSTECLHQSLYARVELALLIPTLIQLCCRLDRPAMVRRLVSALLLAQGYQPMVQVAERAIAGSAGHTVNCRPWDLANATSIK